MSDYALVKDSVVVNVIVAEADFIEFIKNDYDEIVEVILDESGAPNLWIGYTKVNGEWVAPVQEEL